MYNISATDLAILRQAHEVLGRIMAEAQVSGLPASAPAPLLISKVNTRANKKAQRRAENIALIAKHCGSAFASYC